MSGPVVTDGEWDRVRAALATARAVMGEVE